MCTQSTTTRLRRAAALVLLALCGTAQAQLQQSVYGVLDLSYGRFQPSGLERESRFNSNSMTATFVGGNLSYGFENGWTFGATAEAFYRFQTLQAGRNDNDPLLSRNAFVSMAHRDWGTFRLGRLQTNFFNVTTRFNAFGNSVGFSPAVRHVFAVGNLLGVQGDFYWNRAVGYTSPNLLEGLTVNAMAAEGETQDPGQLRSVALVYARGLLAVGLSAQSVKVDDGIGDPLDDRAWQLAASYNFGWAQVFAQAVRTRDRGLDVGSDIVSTGAVVPAGPGSVLAQVATSKATGPAVARKQTTFSLGYLYAWDSQLDVYVVGMDDRVRAQARGVSYAAGLRYRFGP